MKSYTFRLTLLLVLIFAVSNLTAQEYCNPDNCLPAEQCENIVTNGSCPTGTQCCSIVKSEYRTRCNHFGGVCMNRCSDRVWVQQAIDCPNRRCCILV